MTNDLALPDFKKYRYHFWRLWWLPLVAGIALGVLGGASGSYGGGEVAATAVVVPTIANEEKDLLVPITAFETSVAALSSNGMKSTIAAELGYSPVVTVNYQPNTKVATITARGASSERAAAARDAYVAALTRIRTEVITQTIERAMAETGRRVEALEATVAMIDDQIRSLPPSSTAAILAGSDRAQTNAELLAARTNLAALRGIDSADIVDMRVEAVGLRSASPATGGLVRTVGGFLTGAFLGSLVVSIRAYFDERIRTRSDVAALGLRTFGVIDASSPQPVASVLELAAAVGHGAGSRRGPGYQVGLLGFAGVATDRVLGQLKQAADALNVDLPPIATAQTATERIQVAAQSEGVVLLVPPGGVRHADLLHEIQMLDQSGIDLLGVSLVADDARSARRSA